MLCAASCWIKPMLSQRLANLTFVAIIICACGYFAWVAESFTTSGLLASSGLPSKFFPQLMLGIIAICALVVGFQYRNQNSTSDDDNQFVFENPIEARQGILMIVVAIVCYVVWREFGFIAMALIMGPLSLLSMRIYRPLIYGVVLSLTGLITLIFTYGLGIRLI